jgi:hypothetical protein
MSKFNGIPSLQQLNCHSVDTLLGPPEDGDNLPMDLQRQILSEAGEERYEILIDHFVNIVELRRPLGIYDDHHPFGYSIRYRHAKTSPDGNWYGPYESGHWMFDAHEQYHKDVLGTTLKLASPDAMPQSQIQDSDEYGLTLNLNQPDVTLRPNIIRAFGLLAYQGMQAATANLVNMNDGSWSLETPIELFMQNVHPEWSQFQISDVQFVPKHDLMPPYVSKILHTYDSHENMDKIHVMSFFQFSIPLSREQARYKQTYKAAEQTVTPN